jgi:hypothetical protein
MNQSIGKHLCLSDASVRQRAVKVALLPFNQVPLCFTVTDGKDDGIHK